MITIGIDIDGVIADFNKDFIEKSIEVTGRDLYPERPFEITTWNYPESYGYSNEEVHKIWKEIKTSHDFLEELCYLDADFYFITARPGLRSKLQTEIWLELHGFPKPTVLISGDKDGLCKSLGVNFYIDDKVENCEHVEIYSPATMCYMLARPWNRKVKGVPRIDTLYEFLGEIRKGFEE